MGEYVYILTEIANNNYPMYDSSTTIALILRGSVKMVAGVRCNYKSGNYRIVLVGRIHFYPLGEKAS